MCLGRSDVEAPPAPARPAGPRTQPPHTTAQPATHDGAGRVRPPMTLEDMPPEVIREAIRHTASALRDTTYALIGGVACHLLGSRRGNIKDIDIIIPNGERAGTAAILARSSKFGVDDANGTWFNASNNRSYTVDLMEPREMYQSFDRNTATIVVDGIRVLKPALILNYKCFAWTSDDRRPDKKRNDAADIRFLASYMVRNGSSTTTEEVNWATGDFFVEFLAMFPEAISDFDAIGLQASQYLVHLRRT